MATQAAPARIVERSRLLLWLALLATANSFVGRALVAVASEGLARASFDLFGISAILWVAVAAGLMLLRDDPIHDSAGTADFAVAGIVLALALFPVATASAVALTLLAGYMLAVGAAGSCRARAAIIFLSVSGALVWGRVLLGLFSRPVLDIDAFFVAHLIGAQQDGNIIHFIGAPGSFAVAPACSSLQGMSLALVFWAVVNQWFKVPFGRMAALSAVAAMLATMAINIARLAAMAHFPKHFAWIHTGPGAEIAAWVSLAAVVAICLVGARRAIFTTP